jgi:hypothetical protein
VLVAYTVNGAGSELIFPSGEAVVVDLRQKVGGGPLYGQRMPGDLPVASRFDLDERDTGMRVDRCHVNSRWVIGVAGGEEDARRLRIEP